MTQKERISKYLDDFGSITPLEAESVRPGYEVCAVSPRCLINFRRANT